MATRQLVGAVYGVDSTMGMLLSIVIPTRNEERNIRDCILPLKRLQDAGRIEIVVVDNASSDRTVALAREAGVRVVEQGPERSAQRNRGMREARGEYVFFLDADMRVPEATVVEVLDLIAAPSAPDALYVREEMVGAGFWVRVRNYERSYYDGTCIDGLRVFRRALLSEVGGFDEQLYAAEDWDLDRRIRAKTSRIAITRGALRHDEGTFSLRQYLKKKRYYAGNLSLYRQKWHGDETCRRQFGVGYRFWTVFMENGKWRRAVRRPDLLAAIWFYKVLVGIVFLGTRDRESVTGAR